MDLDAGRRAQSAAFSTRLARRLRSLPVGVSGGTARSLQVDKDDEFADAELDALMAQAPSDAHAALLTLRSRITSRHLCPGVLPVPLMLDYQLYNIVTDRSMADRQIAELHRERRVLKFRIPSSVGYALVMRSDYEEMLTLTEPPSSMSQEEFSALTARLACLQASPQTDVSIAGHLLREQLPGTDTDVVALIQAGLLVRGSEDDSFWFAIPSLGSFLRQLRRGNDEVVRLVRKARYQEIMERRLLEARLRHSKLGAAFHLDDLTGSGALIRIRTTGGVLVRLGVKPADAFDN